MKFTILFYLYFILIIINFSQALHCGKKFHNRKCPNKQCCSYLSYCGRSNEYCNISYGCQSEFGRYIGKGSSSSTTSVTITTTTSTTTSTTISNPTISNVINCGSKYGDKMCSGDVCCSESGQCIFDLESCGAGCQKGYGFCLSDREFDKEHCLECEDCFNGDDSTVDRLLCPKTCFKDRNKKNETTEMEPCNEEDIEKGTLTYMDPVRLCSECNKCFDCTQFSEMTDDYPNACKKVSTIISIDGACGPQYNNKVCPDNKCCDKTGHCSITNDSCGEGCQYGYGNCFTSPRRGCIACMECSYCDNKFEALICPSTCYTDPYKSNLSEVPSKMGKYNYKYDCSKINKLCYAKGKNNEIIIYGIN